MNKKIVIYFEFPDIMHKDNSKERRIEKHKKSHQPLSAFYTEEQRQQEQKERHHKTVNDIEMEIFEHLKNHTKKILKKP